MYQWPKSWICWICPDRKKRVGGWIVERRCDQCPELELLKRYVPAQICLPLGWVSLYGLTYNYVAFLPEIADVSRRINGLVLAVEEPLSLLDQHGAVAAREQEPFVDQFDEVVPALGRTVRP